LILADLVLGLVVITLLLISTYMETQQPGHLLRFLFVFNILVGICGLCFHSATAVALMDGKAHTVTWDMASASMVVFWEVFTMYIAWVMFTAASRHIDGELWSHVLCGSVVSAYYAGEDAKDSGEASVASLIGGVICTFLLFSIDLISVVVCGRRDNCSDRVFGTLTAACMSNAVWLIASMLMVLFTRFRGPWAFVLPARCFGPERRLGHIWVSDILQHYSEIVQFILMVVMYTYACGTEERAHGKTRAMMITSATLRLIAFPPIVAIDIASRGER
jgi:hypothetical protein